MIHHLPAQFFGKGYQGIPIRSARTPSCRRPSRNSWRPASSARAEAMGSCLPVALHDAPRISRFWMTKFWGNEYGNDWGMQKKWPMNSEFGKKLQLWRGWIIPGIHGIKWHIATFGLDNYDHWADVERTFMSALPLFGQHDSLVLGVCQPASDQLHYYCWIRWFVLIIEQLMVSRLRGGVLT